MRHPLFRVKIEGDSLWPELVPGKTYWASGWLSVREGDYVVFRNPRGQDPGIVIKKALYNDGIHWIAGGSHKRSAVYTFSSRHLIGRLIT